MMTRCWTLGLAAVLGTVAAAGARAQEPVGRARFDHLKHARLFPTCTVCHQGAKYRFDNRYKDAKVDKAFFVPKLCNQCEHPACVQVCPVGATYKTKDGVVLIDEKHCIGCRYCVQACPYGARYFNEDKGVPDKCNWCYHRITKNLQPACVDACPVGARVFGNTQDKQSPINLFIRNNRVQVLRPESGNSPKVFYVGIDKEVN